MNNKKAGKFRSVNIPAHLIGEIEKLIKEDPTFRYATKADFVTAAVREKLEMLDKLSKNQD
jgi:Arc/MetJ-type ribon-helix-helix transcriptional regulator